MHFTVLQYCSGVGPLATRCRLVLGLSQYTWYINVVGYVGPRGAHITGPVMLLVHVGPWARHFTG
jgi:hypothetical protein